MQKTIGLDHMIAVRKRFYGRDDLYERAHASREACRSQHGRGGGWISASELATGVDAANMPRLRWDHQTTSSSEARMAPGLVPRILRYLPAISDRKITLPTSCSNPAAKLSSTAALGQPRDAATRCARAPTAML